MNDGQGEVAFELDKDWPPPLHEVEGDPSVSKATAGPFIGPRGGKWADPEHTIPWHESPRSILHEIDEHHGPLDVTTPSYGKHRPHTHLLGSPDERHFYIDRSGYAAADFPTRASALKHAATNTGRVVAASRITDDSLNNDERSKVGLSARAKMKQDPATSIWLKKLVVMERTDRARLKTILEGLRSLEAEGNTSAALTLQAWEARKVAKAANLRAGPELGPRGGKWVPGTQRKVHWDEPEPGGPSLEHIAKQKEVHVGDVVYKRDKHGEWQKLVDGKREKGMLPITDRKVLREFSEAGKRHKKKSLRFETSGVRMFHHKKPTDPSEAKNPWVHKWGHLDLDRYPPAAMKKADVKVTTKSDPNSGAVLKFRAANGKLQIAYTQEFHARQAHIKFGRVYELAPHYDDAVDTFLTRMEQHKHTTPERDMACALAIISLTGLRPGSKVNTMADQNTKSGQPTYGVTTMKPEHVKIHDDHISINFVGKKSKENSRRFKNPAIAAYLSHRLYARKKADSLFEIPSDKALIKELTKIGLDGFYPKDFRTLKCTMLGAEALAAEPVPKLPEGDDEKSAKIILKVINKVSAQVADYIGNGAAQQRKSYIHPEVFASWLKLIGADRLQGSFFKGGLHVARDEREGPGDSGGGLQELGGEGSGEAGAFRARARDGRARGVRSV